MSQITKIIRLILADIGCNSNKFWRGELYDNGDVKTIWGRVAMGEQSKLFPGAGESFLLKKEKEKLKKGYTVLRTVDTSGTVINKVSSGNLLDIASKQIKTSSPTLTAMIKKLVEWNIHQITSQTNISLNSNTGLFETCLGVVTLDGINDARNILSECVDWVKHEDYGVGLTNNINRYLRIVPSNIGARRIEPKSFFPDLAAIQKQNGILDSLEASYKALQTQPKNDTGKEQILEEVFKVRLDVLNDQKQRKRLEDNFYKTKKSMHHYDNVKIQEIYEVDIEEMTRNFDASKGNIQEVYHGSSPANCLSILKTGIKCSPPSTAAIAGKMFGNGTYGSQTSSKSIGYTMNRWGQGNVKDVGHLFVCDFAMGNAYYPITSHGLSKIPSGYDSCWALPSKTGLHNDELIVYQDNKVKIKYLLEIK